MQSHRLSGRITSAGETPCLGTVSEKYMKQSWNRKRAHKEWMTGRRWKNPMLCLFLSFVCRKLHNERGGNKMPDLCFYAPWIMKEPIPDPFRMMLEKAGEKTGQLWWSRLFHAKYQEAGKSLPPSWAYVTGTSDTDSDPERKRLWGCRYTKGQGYHKLFLHGISWKSGKVCNDL